MKQGVSGINIMQYAPSHEWTCHFVAIAFIITIALLFLFGWGALLIIVPFYFFYPIFLYVGYRGRRVSVLVDGGKIYVRQGLNAEFEYSLNDVSKFLIIRKQFKSILQINPLEWFFPNINEPSRLVIKKPDDNDLILFSYSTSSPRKRHWERFARKLEAQTGKAVSLVEAN